MKKYLSKIKKLITFIIEAVLYINLIAILVEMCNVLYFLLFNVELALSFNTIAVVVVSFLTILLIEIKVEL